MARKEYKAPEAATCPAWLATYGDMVTLVLTFFVLLFSFSSIDSQSWQDVMSALSGSYSILSGGDLVTALENNNLDTDEYRDPDIPKDAAVVESATDWEMLYHGLKEFAGSVDTGDKLDIIGDAGNILVRFRDPMLFTSGSAVLGDEAQAVLDQFYTEISDSLHLFDEIRMEGHTDNVPINNALYRDNWDLSAARADVVHRYLMAKGLDPRTTKLQAVGCGEFQPVADDSTEAGRAQNNSIEGRALNRRVDIVLVRDTRNDSAVLHDELLPTLLSGGAAPANTQTGG